VAVLVLAMDDETEPENAMERVELRVRVLEMEYTVLPEAVAMSEREELGLPVEVNCMELIGEPLGDLDVEGEDELNTDEVMLTDNLLEALGDVEAEASRDV